MMYWFDLTEDQKEIASEAIGMAICESKKRRPGAVLGQIWDGDDGKALFFRFKFVPHEKAERILSILEEEDS